MACAAGSSAAVPAHRSIEAASESPLSECSPVPSSAPESPSRRAADGGRITCALYAARNPGDSTDELDARSTRAPPSPTTSTASCVQFAESISLYGVLLALCGWCCVLPAHYAKRSPQLSAEPDGDSLWKTAQRCTSSRQVHYGKTSCQLDRKPALTSDSVQLLTWRRRAAVIWDARVRRQMRSYRRHAAASSTRSSEPGVRAGSVGRIASCASCAFFALVLRSVNSRGQHWSMA